VIDELALPTTDPFLSQPDLDLDALAAHWSVRDLLPPVTAEAMRGADVRAQRLGVTGDRLMEEAGRAVAAAATALLNTAGRSATGPILVLCGPGNNGGDGFVAARYLSGDGRRCIVILVASESRPGTPDASRNWQRLDSQASVERGHAASARDVAMLGSGIERASLVIDALLGTGVQGSLREPIRSAVELIRQARGAGVPVLAVDTPTALDLTSGQPSDPSVRADVTITFHRPKEGLRSRFGAMLAGRVLIAPIGIPPEADPA
jgi:ADP-dependent NAD(P)H-hydrate dehydratase / NAD(P)H-hydrate epimerase